MIKRRDAIVILGAMIISACIWIIPISKKEGNKIRYSAKTFQTAIGWGYDILVNDNLFIHQEFIPALAGRKGFWQKEEAEQAAELIINKMKRGQHPAITTLELQKIFSSNKPKYGRMERSQ